MSEATLAPLSMLWSALGPRPAAVPDVPDVGSIAAAAAAQGRAEGRAEAEAELAPLHAALADAATALRAAQAIDAETLQPLFADLVARIASAVVDAELQAGPAVIDRLVAAARRPIRRPGASGS